MLFTDIRKLGKQGLEGLVGFGKGAVEGAVGLAKQPKVLAGATVASAAAATLLEMHGIPHGPVLEALYGPLGSLVNTAVAPIPNVDAQAAVSGATMGLATAFAIGSVASGLGGGADGLASAVK